VLSREDGSVLIEIHRDSDNILFANWVGQNVPLEEVKQGCALVKQEIEKHGCRLWFNDTSHVKGSWDEANEWLVQEFFPQAIAKGLARMGNVLSKDIFAELSAEFMAENLEAVATSPDAFQIRLFKEGDQALQWLRQHLA